jgi:hypothetical protein
MFPPKTVTIVSPTTLIAIGFPTVARNQGFPGGRFSDQPPVPHQRTRGIRRQATQPKYSHWHPLPSQWRKAGRRLARREYQAALMYRLPSTPQHLPVAGVTPR